MGFSEETRELFNRGGYAVSSETGKNDADSLHHIMGRISDSPYNAAPLNNFRDHMPDGRKGLPAITSDEVKAKYLKKTKQFLDSIGYIPDESDLHFLRKYNRYYQ